MDDAHAIAALRTDWDSLPLAVAATFDDPTPSGIAEAVRRFAVEQLGSEVAAYEFLSASVSTVVGLRLATGRRIVVKVHRPETSMAYLEAVQSVQSELARGGFPSPQPLVGPTELGLGIAVAESLLDRGARPEGHDPAARPVLAAGLAQLIERCRPFVGSPALKENFMAAPSDRLWPRPHDLRFDFEASSVGAEWIDEIAAAAKAVRDSLDAGDLVVGHTDWRVEHVRIADDALSAVYDWDLAVAPEPTFVGGAAHGFTADWSVTRSRQIPTAEEALAFIDEYEAARGRVFTDGECRCVHAALVYAMAYMARCEHSDLLTDSRGRPPQPPERVTPVEGSARAFLKAHAADLLV